MKVEIYSDVVCPWCYIGERRFGRALAAFGREGEVEVVFRPYQLDPAAPRTALPLAEYLGRRYGSRAGGMMAQAGAAAAGEGITIDWERALSANTFDAHRLLHLAEREHGPAVQRALARKLFELHFTRGGDVSDPERLVELARFVGMEPERVRAFLGSDEGVREVEAQLDAARRLGIRAVPTFVFDGRFAVEGAQPVSTFLRALEEAAAAEEAPVAAGGASCEDGACDV